MQVDSLLINESQLGSQLNQCVHQSRRSDFSLMLAMLSQDVRDFSEFHSVDNDTAESTQESDLRALFDLPQEKRMGLTSMDEVEEFNQAHLIEEGGLSTIRLNQCVKPQALAFRDDKEFIDTVVTSNLSPCQQRHLASGESTIAKSPDTNVQMWLKSVKTAMAKSSEISLHSTA